MELFQRIEQLISKKLPLYHTVEEEVLALMERVTEAQRHAKMVPHTCTCTHTQYTSSQELSAGGEERKRKGSAGDRWKEEEGKTRPRKKRKQ